jgi:hypothetical protein
MPDDIIREARECRQIAQDAYQDNWSAMEVDLRFAAGGEHQWDPQVYKERGNPEAPRPRETFNRLGPYVKQVANDIRLNPPSARVRPADSGADVKVAKTFTGLIRAIEADSACPYPYVVAAENAIRCGLGWFMVECDYAGEDSFDLALRIAPVHNPFSVMMDPDARDACWQDAMWGFHESYYTERAYKLRWPKASSTESWDGEARAHEWCGTKGIRVAAYWRKVEITRKLIRLPDSSVVDRTKLDDAEVNALVGAAMDRVMQAGHAPIEPKEIERRGYRVERRLLNGVEELEERKDWYSQYLPMVPVRGEEVNLGERVVRKGLIADGRGAQTLYNVQRNALIEAVAMAPKAKWTGTVEQFAGLDGWWKQANVGNFAYLPYNNAPGVPPPQRVAPDMPSASLLQDISLAAQDIEATIGVFRDNLGKESNAQSGRAILSRQREGDTGTYHFMDNLATAVEHGVRILVDAIPRVYDAEERVIRILGEDGAEEFARINVRVPVVGPDGMQAIGEDGRPKFAKAHDLSQGRYDVVASVGPSFSTRREEARESMLAFMQASPQSMPAIMDLFAKANDWPGSEEITKRLRMVAIRQGFAKPNPEDEDEAELAAQMAQGPPPDPNMVLAQAEMAKAQATVMKAETDRIVEAEKLKHATLELLIRAKEVGIDERVAMATVAEKLSNVGIRQAAAEFDQRRGAAELAMSAADRAHARQSGDRDAAMRMMDMGHRQRMDGAKHAMGERDMEFRHSQPPKGSSAGANHPGAAPLRSAIARHDRHLAGTEPTSEASQMRMMDEMRDALTAMGRPHARDMEFRHSQPPKMPGGGAA